MSTRSQIVLITGAFTGMVFAVQSENFGRSRFSH